MGRRRDGDGLPLEIELLDGVGADEQEVQFGGRVPRSGRQGAGSSESDPSPIRRRTRAWTVLGTTAAIAALVGAGSLLGSGGDSTSPSTTAARTTTSPSTSTTEAPIVTLVTTPPVSPVTDPPPLKPIVVSTYPPFAPESPPIGSVPSVPPTVVPAGPAGPLDASALASLASAGTLYLWDTQRGPTALVAYDLATGQATDVPLGDAPGPIKSVIPTAFGPVVDAGTLVMVTALGPVPVGSGDPGITDFTQTGPRIAVGPGVGGDDALIWVRTLEPAGLVLFDPETGRTTDAYELPLGTELIGATEAGKPVVRGADLDSYQIMEDGSSLAIADGITTPVERGRFAEVSCQPPTSCLVSLHAGLLFRSYGLTAASDLERTALRFAPNGTRVAISFDGFVRIVEPLTADAVDVPFTHVATGDPVSRPVANYFRMARDLVWTPDSRVLGLLTDQGIVFVDTTGVAISTVVLDPANPLRYVPLAVG